MLWGALSLLACRLLASVVLPVYDDAFITLRYARNLATGHGFVYEAGQRILGTTTPLFGLLCSIPYALHLPMPGTVRLLNIACDLATLALTWTALPERSGRWARPLFAAFFAASPILNRICVGGMEMNLYLLVSVIAIRLHGPRRNTAVALAAAAYFLRPESLLLVGLLLAMTLRREGWRAALGPAALAVGILGLPVLAIHAFYGASVSQSVLAKWAMAKPPTEQVLQRLLAYEPVALVLLPLTAWGLWRTLPKAGFASTVGWWALLQVAAYVAARPNIWSWYVEPVAYASMLLAACGGSDLLERWATLRRAGTARWAMAGACILAVLPWVGIAARQGTSPVTRNVFVPLEQWCRTHTGPGVSIMAYDVGAVGYYSGSRIYDLAGLVWPEGLTRTGEEVMRRYAPDYLYLNATLATARLAEAPAFRSQYRPIRRFSKNGDQSLELKVADATSEWAQDYILYQRLRPRDLPSRAAGGP